MDWRHFFVVKIIVQCVCFVLSHTVSLTLDYLQESWRYPMNDCCWTVCLQLICGLFKTSCNWKLKTNNSNYNLLGFTIKMRLFIEFWVNVFVFHWVTATRLLEGFYFFGLPNANIELPVANDGIRWQWLAWPPANYGWIWVCVFFESVSPTEME